MGKAKEMNDCNHFYCFPFNVNMFLSNQQKELTQYQNHDFSFNRQKGEEEEEGKKNKNQEKHGKKIESGENKVNFSVRRSIFLILFLTIRI